MNKPSRLLRFGLWLLLVLVLGIGFLGYLHPSMQLQWETIATMCGF
ncbi:hypothetical protein [Sheuella amnicola]|nr:hypothetical protein [Sheuella amnicola]